MSKTKEESSRAKAFPSTRSRRPISPGGEYWLGRRLPVLDHGFLYLVDYMGNDEAIEQAARVSYGKGTRSVSATEVLIRYLMRHQHMTPFEMVTVKIHAKMPIFVARQWVRHRTASLNEISGRYSIMPEEVYIPNIEMIASQSTNNRQGRGKAFDPAQAELVRQLLIDDAMKNYDTYEYLINDDGHGKPVDESRGMLARELARIDLTLNTYTEWYWQANLRNAMGFLGLRMDPHAQYEIRVYADAMARITKDLTPIAWGAFNDYTLEALHLSGPEVSAMALLLQAVGKFSDADIERVTSQMGFGKREKDEFAKKLSRIEVPK